MGQYLDINKRTYQDVVIPTPSIIMSHVNATGTEINDGGYTGLDVNGQPTKDIVTFAAANYPTYSGGINLNVLTPNLLKCKWDGTQTQFLNYNPRIVLYIWKHAKNKNRLLNIKTKKTDWVRITHLDGQLGNRSVGNKNGNKTGSIGFYDQREALFPLSIDPTFPERSSLLTTNLTGFNPLDYVSIQGLDGNGNPLNGYGQDIFPISISNWHNDDNTVGTFFGTHGILRTFMRGGGKKYRMNSKRLRFKIAIEIDNPLTYGNPVNGLNPTGSSSKTLVSSLSNEIIVEPQQGTFFDSSNSNTVGSYYYRWKVIIGA